MDAPEKKPSQKKRVNSKGKGNGFELAISKKLSTSLSPLKFIRSPQSGARTGGKNFEAFGQMFGKDALVLFTADVVPTNERDTNLIFKWSIECKFYKTPDSFGTLVNGNANIFKWFEESVTDSKKTNKEPILIFKWNNTPVYIAVDINTSNVDRNKFTPKISLSNSSRQLDIFLFDDLIDNKEFWIK